MLNICIKYNHNHLVMLKDLLSLALCVSKALLPLNMKSYLLIRFGVGIYGPWLIKEPDVLSLLLTIRSLIICECVGFGGILALGVNYYLKLSKVTRFKSS